jgi:hypothetical protein
MMFALLLSQVPSLEATDALVSLVFRSHLFLLRETISHLYSSLPLKYQREYESERKTSALAGSGSGANSAMKILDG